MSIKELFDEAIKYDYIDLQALLMFLVFEKKVLTMEDDTKKLDLYFLEKHHERMNKELATYKKKMNMKYGMNVYKFAGRFYVLAKSIEQAKFLAGRNNIPVEKVEMVSMDKLMNFNGLNITLRELTKNKEPSILGGF